MAAGVDELIRTSDSLFSNMHSNAGEWEELRRRMMPRLETRARQDEIVDAMTVVGDYCPVAGKAALNLNSAHMLLVTPMDQKWFSLKPWGDNNGRGEDDDWYSQATEALAMGLADSNFYAKKQEAELDCIVTGTGCMFAKVGRDGKFVFEHVPTGTYAIAEDCDGMVNTLARELKYTPAQAVEQFGEAALPDKIRRAFNRADKRFSEVFDFIHLVVPNKDAMFGSDFVPEHKRKWRDVYICKDNKRIVYDSGFYEFPFFVHRFLRQGGTNPYGFALGSLVLPEIKSVLLMDRIMDVAGSRAAMPSILMAAEMVGEVDLRAGGKTIVPQELYGVDLPRAWAQTGDVRFMLERQQTKEQAIKEAFYNDVLQVITSVDRTMTATEVNARESERLLSFFGSFVQFCSDFQVMMKRLLCLMWRNKQGVMLPPNPPQSFFSRSVSGEQLEVIPPQVRYCGKIAQAYERMQRTGLLDVLETVGKFIQVTGDGRIATRIKPWEVLNFMWDACGAPSKCIMSFSENEQATKAEQEQAKQAQQAALLDQLSKAQMNGAKANATQNQAL